MMAGIHQLHYLPWLRYFDKIVRCDVFIVLDCIQYNKNGWQNRNKVKTASGPAILTVPVHAPMGCRLDEVRVDDTQPWRRKHWATLKQSYGKAPYFDWIASELESVYSKKWGLLNELNAYLLDFFVKALGIRTRIEFASRLDVSGRATDRLVKLTKAVGANSYFSGAYALEQYLDSTLLEREGIALSLQEWRSPVYPQLHGTFIPDLSIVDLLFNCGPDSLNVLLGKTPPPVS